MRGTGAALAITLIVGFTLSLVGCASQRMSYVSVSDVQSVAGKWTGEVYQSQYARSHIELIIRNDGSYDAASHERVFAPGGKGKVVIKDGRLLFQGEKGGGIGRLLRDPGGDRMLEIEMTLSDNSHLILKLTPSR